MIKLSKFYRNKKIPITGATGFKEHGLLVGYIKWVRKYMVSDTTLTKIKIFL